MTDLLLLVATEAAESTAPASDLTIIVGGVLTLLGGITTGIFGLLKLRKSKRGGGEDDDEEDRRREREAAQAKSERDANYAAVVERMVRQDERIDYLQQQIEWDELRYVMFLEDWGAMLTKLPPGMERPHLRQPPPRPQPPPNVRPVREPHP